MDPSQIYGPPEVVGHCVRPRSQLGSRCDGSSPPLKIKVPPVQIWPSAPDLITGSERRRTRNGASRITNRTLPTNAAQPMYQGQGPSRSRGVVLPGLARRYM